MSENNNNKTDNKFLRIGLDIFAVISGLASLGLIRADIDWEIKVSVWVIIGGIVGWIVISKLLQSRIKHKKEDVENEKYIRDCLDNDDFHDTWLDRTTDQPYVEIEYQKTSPAEYYEPNKPTEEVKRHSLRKAFVEDFFNKTHRGSKYAAILGDSGSGKTTSLANLLIDYVNHYHITSLPYDIRIFAMGDKNVWDKIDECIDKKDRGKYILLLDALDENEDAQVYLSCNGIENYLKELAEKTKDFARVVITSRTQFFKDEKSEPGLIRLIKDRKQEWQKYYLSPFSEEQVGSYLTQKFGVPSNDPKSEKARIIVLHYLPVFCRPLILSWIDDIIDAIPDSEKISIKNVYDLIIAAWSRRDADGDEEIIMARYIFSHNLAVFMYINGLNAVNDEQYRQFLAESGIEDKDDLFLGRSLLNRGTDGYKFSHRSFYEYFLAHIFFGNPGAIQSVQGLDFAVRIFDELYNEYETEEGHTEEEDTRVAWALRNMGRSLYELNHFAEAEEESNKARDLFSKLAEKNSDYNYCVAMVLNDLAGLHSHYDVVNVSNMASLPFYTNRYDQYDKVEAEYTEALSIYRQFAEKNPENEEYQSDVAMTLNNLAGLYRKNKQYDKAVDVCAEALGIYRKLREKKPEVYLSDMTKTLANLAILHTGMQQYNEAENNYIEALGIFLQLSRNAPENVEYQLFVAQTLHNLAVLYNSTHQYDKAVVEYKKALGIYRQLAEKNHDAFQYYVAKTLYNIAETRMEMGGDLDIAEAEAQESLEKYQFLAGLSIESFVVDLRLSQILIENIHKAKKEAKK